MEETTQVGYEVATSIANLEGLQAFVYASIPVLVTITMAFVGFKLVRKISNRAG